MKFIFRTRFSWFDVLLMTSTPFLASTIGWWTIPVVFVGAALSVATSVKLGVD